MLRGYTLKGAHKYETCLKKEALQIYRNLTVGRPTVLLLAELLFPTKAQQYGIVKL